MSKKNENLKTLLVATVLCLFCSVIVSVVATSLKDRQDKNAVLDFKKNILMSAGLLSEGVDVEEAFNKIETILVDFETGSKVEASAEVVAAYNQVSASNKPETNVTIPASEDLGGLSTRAKKAKVYLTRKADGSVDLIILNVRGKGLWSTMFGFLALESDTKTIKGFAYYKQGETPGLGGEVDNPTWKSQWIGKKLYNDNFEVAFKVNKGAVDNSHPSAQFMVDGLSGATITADGVTSSTKYWFGNHGYAKFLEKVRAGEI